MNIKKQKGDSTLSFLLFIFLIWFIFFSDFFSDCKEESTAKQTTTEQKETFVQPNKEDPLRSLLTEEFKKSPSDAFGLYIHSLYTTNGSYKTYCEESDPDGDMRVICTANITVNDKQELIQAACLINGTGCTAFN